MDPLFVDARDAMVIDDLATGLIVAWNRSAEIAFGYSASEVIGRPSGVLLPQAVARLHRERIAQYRRTGDHDVLNGPAPLGLVTRNKSGEELHLELSMRPLELRGAAAKAILLTFRDARFEKRAEVSMLDATRAESARVGAETKLRRCEELLFESAHELERPLLRARQAAARLVRVASDGDVPPRRLALLAQVIEGRTHDVKRNLELIVDTAAIETGVFELSFDRVNLVPLVSQLVASARTRGKTHRLNFSAPQGLTAQCDGRRLECVIVDLIDRAMRRNPRGCWIDVDLRRPLTGVARIEVRDYGRVSARSRPALANPPDSDRGWFVNRYIIEQHRGSLAVDFPSDGDVRVVVSIPTHHARALAAQA